MRVFSHTGKMSSRIRAIWIGSKGNQPKRQKYEEVLLRRRSINNAEFDRCAGGLGPEYLAGVAYPWHSDRGHAPIHYDVNQVNMRQSVIDAIKNNNAVSCQLECTENKNGPKGQGRR